MHHRWQWAVVAMVAALCVSAGCAHRTPAPKPVAKPPAAAKATLPLPDWAPKSPSPEFLRAAQVLKPMPTENEIRTNVVKSGYTKAVQDRIRRLTWPASYELFGSLTDDHMATFLARKEVSIMYKSLDPKEHKALERWFEAEREAHKGDPGESEDWRVFLYKMGAKEDFSNLRVGFGTHDTHVVGVCFWVIGDKGDLRSRVFSDFAQI